MAQSQTIDIHGKPVVSILEKFKSAIETKSEKSRPAYIKALNAYISFLSNFKGNESNAGLADFALHLYLGGLTAKTANHYLDLLSALAPAEIKELFSQELKAAKNRLPEIWNPELDKKQVERFISFTRSSDNAIPNEEDRLIRAILLLALVNLEYDVYRIASLRKEEIENFGEASLELINQYVSPGRKYVFPLNQTQFTPRQLRLLIDEKARALFARRLLKWFGTAGQTLSTFRQFSLLYNAGHIQDYSPGIGERLFLSPTPLRWYALRLRRGVTYETFGKTIEGRLHDSHVPAPELYYPYREQSVKVDGKVKFIRKPVIRDIVFLRYRSVDIPALMKLTGDKAWCYRSAGTYAAIPEESMRLFRQTVESFTPEVEVAPAGSLPIGPDEEVIVVGGLFTGLEAKVLETMHTRRGVVFRLRIFGDNNDIEWRITDPSLLRKKL